MHRFAILPCVYLLYSVAYDVMDIGHDAISHATIMLCYLTDMF